MDRIRMFFKKFLLAMVIGALIAIILQWLIASIVMVIATAVVLGFIVYILIHVYFFKQKDDN